MRPSKEQLASQWDEWLAKHTDTGWDDPIEKGSTPRQWLDNGYGPEDAMIFVCLGVEHHEQADQINSVIRPKA